jgi:hypothetical protein
MKGWERTLWHIKISDRLSENVVKFKYFGTTVTDRNLIGKRLNSGDVCYHLVQNLSSSRLLSKT